MPKRRTLHLSWIVAGVVAFPAIAAGAAPAATTRVAVSAPPALPTITSPIVGTGSSIGTAPANSTVDGLISMSYTQPDVGSGPVTGSCSTGNFSARISGPNPGQAIDFDSAAARMAGCTDNNPNWDLESIVLTSPPSFTVENVTSAGASLRLINPTFIWRYRTASGITFSCAVSTVGGSMIGTFKNSDAGYPTLTFTNIALKSTTSTSTCATNIGDDTSSVRRTTLTAKFGSFKQLSGAPTVGVGHLIGLFP